MLSLKPGELLLDPCFGFGAFLQAARNAGHERVVGYEIDPKLYSSVRDRFPEYQLVLGDFLLAEHKQAYDKIIMNPPYVRHERIDQLQSFGVCKEELHKSELFQSLPRTANLYMYFIVKALDLLKAEGEMVVIFPSSWMAARGGRRFAQVLQSRAVLQEQVHVAGSLFEGNPLVSVLILHLKKSEQWAATKIVHKRFEDNNVIDLHPNLAVHELGFSVPLRAYATVRRGLTTGCNALFINPPSHLQTTEIVSSPKDVPGYHVSNARFDRILLLDRNSHLPADTAEYLEEWKNRISKEKTPKTLYFRILQGDPNWYSLNDIESRGLLFGYFVRNEPRFLCNPAGHRARDNFYVISPRREGLLLFALLNNYYTYYQLEMLGKQYGAGLLKLQKYDIERLTLPDLAAIPAKTKELLTREAERLLAEGKSQSIQLITNTLSDLSLVDSDSVQNLYEQAKMRRLKN